jgi:hypothetical protein
MSSSLRRRVLQDAAGGAVPPLAAGSWDSRFPSLVEFLAAATWPDGEARIRGSLVLFTDGQTWKACLSDKDQSCTAFISGEDPEAVLQAAETGLLEDRLDWRADRRNKGKNRKE